MRISNVPIQIKVFLFIALAPLVWRIAAGETGESKTLTLQIHPTFGVGGPERSNGVIAGDTLFATARVENLGVDTEGKVAFSTQTELLTKDGQLINIFPAQQSKMHLAFGGAAVSHIAFVHLPSTMEAGDYRIRMGVSDQITRRTAVEEFPFELLDASTLGAIDLRLCHDQPGNVPAGKCFQVGQTAFVHFTLCGFAIKEKHMEVKCMLTVLDKNKQAVGSPPLTLSAKRDIIFSREKELLPAHFHLNVNQAGEYYLRLQIDDVLSKKQSTHEIPFVAVDVPQADHARHAVKGNQAQPR